MMPLVLSEDEAMLADAARGLFDRNAPVTAFRAMRDAGMETRYDPELFARIAENGLVAPNISEADGGVGMGAAAAGVIAEQAGHNLVAAPFFGAALGAALIGKLGDPGQRARLLPAIMAGEKIVAVALDEAMRHDPDQLETTALGDDRITGRKTAVVDGVGAHLLIVSARLGDEQRLFLVDPASSGCVTTPIPTIDSRNIATVSLDNAPAEALGGCDASDAIGATLDLGRALLAAELLGIADQAFDMTIGYLREREQFGRKIGTYQALQHRAARLYARLDLARGVVLKALRAIDDNAADSSETASLAKCVMTSLARDVLVEAVQMHGGIGVTDEFDIGLFFKRARIAGELLGDDRFHAERLARLRWKL